MKKTLLSLISSLTIVSGVIIPTTSSCAKQELSDWNKDVASFNSLTDFVHKVTDKGSDTFVPVDDRIAVFDFDGTVYGELAPQSFHWSLLRHRVEHDPTFTPNEKQKLAADMIEEVIRTHGEISKELADLQKDVEASLYEGMTVTEYKQYVSDFAKNNAESFNNVTYGTLFYKPMVEVIDYLNDNDFKVYFMTGSDTHLCRALAKGNVDVPDERIYGTFIDIETVDGKVVRGDEYLYWNLEKNKVRTIEENIEKQPILSFGNSSGDYDMLSYVTTGNKYLSKGFMVINDDNVREHGNLTKAAERKQYAEQHGWVPISMKNDWKTIYGDNVTAIQW